MKNSLSVGAIERVDRENIRLAVQKEIKRYHRSINGVPFVSVCRILRDFGFTQSGETAQRMRQRILEVIPAFSDRYGKIYKSYVLPNATSAKEPTNRDWLEPKASDVKELVLILRKNGLSFAEITEVLRGKQ